VTVDAARATGLSEWQILRRVEIPLALPLIVGGIRASFLQVIATAVIASYIGLGGIGRIISSGIGLNDNDRILGGALLVTALALIVDATLALVQRLTRPRGTDTSPSWRVSALKQDSDSRAAPSGRPAVAERSANERE
jgi:osmoprotectant transport system permease protein